MSGYVMRSPVELAECSARFSTMAQQATVNLARYEAECVEKILQDNPSRAHAVERELPLAGDVLRITRVMDCAGAVLGTVYLERNGMVFRVVVGEPSERDAP